MFKRVLLTFMFIVALGAAGLAMSGKAMAQGCGGYGNYGNGGYANYGNGGYGYGASYPAYYGNGYGPGVYGYAPSVSYYGGSGHGRGYGHSGYYGGGHHGHGGAHFSIGF